MQRLIGAAVTGAVVALLPLLVLAAEPLHGGASGAVEGRAVPPPADMSMIVWVTVLSLTALFVTLAIGYLYRSERHLDWPFQAAAPTHDDAHH